MKNLKSEIDETLELSGMFGGGKLYEDKNGNPRFEGEDIKELLSGKLLSLFKQQMKEIIGDQEEVTRIDRKTQDDFFSSHPKEVRNEFRKKLLKNIEDL